MEVIDRIGDLFLNVSKLFSNLAWACWGVPLLPEAIGDFFWDLYNVCLDIRQGFYNFSARLDNFIDKIREIITWEDIQDWFSDWFDKIEKAWNWVRNAWDYVTDIIEEWWRTVEDTILDKLGDIKDWTVTQLNSIRDTVLSLISDVKDWTTTQVNNIRDTVLGLITDVKNWTTTQLGNVREAILLALSNLETWTATQLNNFRETISILLPWEDILANIIAWGALPGKAINDLIESWFKDFEHFWAGWEDMRDTVFGFFDDPLQWLLDRFTDWFLGPEE